VFTVAAIMAGIFVRSSTVVTESNSTPATQNIRKFKHQSTHFHLFYNNQINRLDPYV